MHPKTASASTRNRFVVSRIVASSFVAFVSAACGVHEHPHPNSRPNGANDFARVGDTPTDRTRNGSSMDAGNDARTEESIMDAVDAGTDAAIDEGDRPAADGGSADAKQAAASAAAKGKKGTPATSKAASKGAAGSGPVADGGTPRSGADGGATGAPPPPPEMPALVLDGVPLRKEDVLAFIHFGHSNMQGCAMDPEELRPYFFTETHPRVWMYHVGTPPVLATEPTAREERLQKAGPGVALLKQAAELAPNKYFMSLGFARDGAACLRYVPGGAFHEELIASVVAIKDRVTFAGIVVMLGSVEIGGDGATASTLPDCFIALAKSIREAAGTPDLPMLFSGYEVGGTGNFLVSNPGPQKVIVELAKVPGLVSNSAIVSADGIAMQDDHHFNLTGHMMWTKRVLDIMQDKGWFPWAATPPAPATP